MDHTQKALCLASSKMEQLISEARNKRSYKKKFHHDPYYTLTEEISIRSLFNQPMTWFTVAVSWKEPSGMKKITLASGG